MQFPTHSNAPRHSQSPERVFSSEEKQAGDAKLEVISISEMTDFLKGWLPSIMLVTVLGTLLGTAIGYFQNKIYSKYKVEMSVPPEGALLDADKVNAAIVRMFGQTQFATELANGIINEAEALAKSEALPMSEDNVLGLKWLKRQFGTNQLKNDSVDVGRLANYIITDLASNTLAAAGGVHVERSNVPFRAYAVSGGQWIFQTQNSRLGEATPLVFAFIRALNSVIGKYNDYVRGQLYANRQANSAEASRIIEGAQIIQVNELGKYQKARAENEFSFFMIDAKLDRLLGGVRTAGQNGRDPLREMAVAGMAKDLGDQMVRSPLFFEYQEANRKLGHLAIVSDKVPREDVDKMRADLAKIYMDSERLETNFASIRQAFRARTAAFTKALEDSSRPIDAAAYSIPRVNLSPEFRSLMEYSTTVDRRWPSLIGTAFAGGLLGFCLILAIAVLKDLYFSFRNKIQRRGV